jgi:hypothetical protein
VEIEEEKLAIWLSVVAGMVILLDYSLVKVEGFSLSVGVLEVSKVEISSLLPVIAALALILGMLIYHVLNMFHALSFEYRLGYINHEGFRALVAEKIAAASRTDKYGSPCGGKSYGLLPMEFDYGEWSRPDGTLSPRVWVRPSWKTHFGAALSGIRYCHNFRVALSWYGPIVLAVWAITCIAA